MRLKRSLAVLLTALLASLAGPVAGAEAAESSFSVRLRFESSAQDNSLEDARATTLQARLGLTSPSWNDVTGLVEFEGVSALGSERYNSGPGGNGQTRYSVIPDPAGYELNRAQLSYTGIAGTELIVGRQRIVLDDARFVGNVGWRQNEQTFDGASLRGRYGSVALFYAYLGNANTIFFGDVDMDSHLLNLAWTLAPGHVATAYGYWIDRIHAGDSQTQGLRFSGRLRPAGLTFRYLVEAAAQRPFADAPDAFEADFLHLELGLAGTLWSVAAGIESLGGNGVYGFSTPLATLHKFNGWADAFLVTPASGLEDRYLSLGVHRGPWRALAVYHDFSAHQGDTDFGSEWDASLGWRIAKGSSLLLKYADYRARTHAVDTRKFWLQLSHAF